MFIVYDFTNKRYHARHRFRDQTFWSHFRTDAYRFETRVQAEEQARFWRGVNANDYRVISY